MKNNIVQKHSLKDYNKRYRHHKNLLKISKKEVEEFDKTFNTVGEHYLLRKNKWWFIDGTYYQIPKTLHHYWFRNLNAGVQTAICLLGAGVVATGASLPYILKLGQTEGPTITITGANYDKANSHIELHKESTIALVKQDKDITGVEYVKVDDKELSTTQYSFNETTKVVTIKAEAMTSTKIEIKVKTGEPIKKVTKAEFVEKANELVTGDNGFINSRLEYKSSQVKYTMNGIEYKIKGLTYGLDDDGKRCATLSFEGGTILDAIIGGYVFSGTSLDNNFGLKKETVEGVTYTIGDDEISYEDQNATGEEFKKISLNKYGYVTELDDDGEFNDVKVEYIGELEIYYNIDWVTSKFDFQAGGEKTLYEYAKSANTIEFIEDSNVGNVCVGETIGESENRDPVYASYDFDLFGTKGYVLKIWSKEKISFKDNDRKDSNATGFFTNCRDLKTIDFSNIDTSKTTNFKNTFNGCNSLEEANFEYFDTSSATNMWSMFGGTAFKSLNLSSFDTSKVTTMVQMFSGMNDLITIDLSSFDTSKVTNMNNMFTPSAGCESSLQTIYVSEKFNTDSVTVSNGMFTACAKLVGGKGTTFDLDHVNKEYARIDDPDNGNPGYFTSSEDKKIAKLKYIGYDGNGISEEEEHGEITQYKVYCDNADKSLVETVNIPETYNSLPVTGIHLDYNEQREGFQGCTSIKSITLPNNMTSISTASFASCSSLEEVHLGTSLNSVYRHSFSGCPLKKVYFSNKNGWTYEGISIPSSDLENPETAATDMMETYPLYNGDWLRS